MLLQPAVRLPESADPQVAGVALAQLRSVVLLQAQGAPWDGPRLSRERLVVETEVRDRLVQILGLQCLPMVTSIVRHPASVIEIPLGADDGSLIGEQLRGLLNKARRDQSCHRGELLNPCRDILDLRPSWKWRLPSARSWGIVKGDFRHLLIPGRGPSSLPSSAGEMPGYMAHLSAAGPADGAGPAMGRDVPRGGHGT